MKTLSQIKVESDAAADAYLEKYFPERSDLEKAACIKEKFFRATDEARSKANERIRESAIKLL